MNAGMYGLPGGTQGRRVVGLLNGARTWTGGVGVAAAAANTINATYINTTNNIEALFPLFSVTGNGIINWAGVSASVPTGGNFRAVLEIDGVRLIDVSDYIAQGYILIGSGNTTGSSNAVATFQPVPFYSGFRILVASSFTASSTQVGYVNAEIHA